MFAVEHLENATEGRDFVLRNAEAGNALALVGCAECCNLRKVQSRHDEQAHVEGLMCEDVGIGNLHPMKSTVVADLCNYRLVGKRLVAIHMPRRHYHVASDGKAR